MPLPVLPEMTLRAAAVVPPMVLSIARSTIPRRRRWAGRGPPAQADQVAFEPVAHGAGILQDAHAAPAVLPEITFQRARRGAADRVGRYGADLHTESTVAQIARSGGVRADVIPFDVILRR